MSEQMAESAGVDHLGAFLQFADHIDRIYKENNSPAYSETCICGGSVLVGRETSRAELRRIHADFLGRHQRCATPPTQTGADS